MEKVNNNGDANNEVMVKLKINTIYKETFLIDVVLNCLNSFETRLKRKRCSFSVLINLRPFINILKEYLHDKKTLMVKECIFEYKILSVIKKNS